MKTILLTILITLSTLFVAGQGQLVSVAGFYSSHKGQSGTNSFYYFTGSEDGVASLGDITFFLGNFTNGDIIYFIFENIVDGSEIRTANLTVNNNLVSVPISTISSGIYRVRLFDNKGNNTLTNVFLLVENVETFDYTGDASIQNMPLKFYTHYNSDYFPNTFVTNVNTLKGYVKEGWKKSWVKENNEWNLCQGLPGNTIPDNDGTFDIHLFDNTKIQDRISETYLYHGTGVTGYVVSDDGLMFLNSDFNFLLSYGYPLDMTLIDEPTIITEVISHEMLHGIQNSWVPYANETNIKDYSKREWLREGQARFLQTVIMGEANMIYKGKNVAMLNNIFKNHGSFYEKNTKTYLDSILRLKIPPKLEHVSYQYAMFWRHLYEHNFPPATTTATRMELLRETMKTNTSALLSDIKQKMDVALLSASGNFLTFEDAIKDFTKRVYFYHKDWSDTLGNKLNNWQDPNNCNFYETLASGISDVPSVLMNPCFSKNFEIKSSYGFVPHRFIDASPGKYTFKFNSDPDGDGNMATFYVKTFITENKILKSETECVLTSGTGSINFEIKNANENLVVIVLRLDLNEANNNNYNIDISPADPLQADFKGTPDAGNEYYDVSFNDKSKGIPTQYQWDFGEGTTATTQSRLITYQKSGSYNVVLTVTNCKGTDTKTVNNYVNLLPPFIENVEIIGDGSTYTASQFTRAYDDSTGTYSCDNSPQKIESGKDLIIKVRSTAPLQKLKLQIFRADNKDGAGHVEEQTSSGTTQRDWEFHVSKSDFSKGFNNIWFTGTDYSNNQLLKDAIPPYRAVVISATGYTGPDLTQITGTDKNYFMYIDPWFGLASRNMDVIVDKTDCSGNQTSIFVYSNYDKDPCDIDFGDGTTPISIKPNYMLPHTYNTSVKKTFTITMIKNGSVISSKTLKF